MPGRRRYQAVAEQPDHVRGGSTYTAGAISPRELQSASTVASSLARHTGGRRRCAPPAPGRGIHVPIHYPGDHASGEVRRRALLSSFPSAQLGSNFADQYPSRDPSMMPTRHALTASTLRVFEQHGESLDMSSQGNEHHTGSGRDRRCVHMRAKLDQRRASR